MDNSKGFDPLWFMFGYLVFLLVLSPVVFLGDLQAPLKYAVQFAIAAPLAYLVYKLRLERR